MTARTFAPDAARTPQEPGRGDEPTAPGVIGWAERDGDSSERNSDRLAAGRWTAAGDGYQIRLDVTR